MAVLPIDMQALTLAISEGIGKGNAPLIAALVNDSSRRHSLAETVQVNVDKIYEVDSELRAVKGQLVMLIGEGDGSTGLIPRLEKDTRVMGDDVSTLKGDVRSLRGDMTTVLEELKAIRLGQGSSKAFMDGWKGVAIALGILGTCFSIAGALAAACVWLYAHGGVK